MVVEILSVWVCVEMYVVSLFGVLGGVIVRIVVSENVVMVVLIMMWVG